MFSRMIKELWSKAVVEKPAGFPWAIFRGICRPLGLVYELLVRIRLDLYRYNLLKSGSLARRSDGAVIKIISVGNITVGGTGKTPMVAYLAGLLAGRGYKTAILTRGYGRIAKQTSNLKSQISNIQPARRSAMAGGDDEAFIMERAGLKNVSRLVGPNRYQLAQTLAQQNNAQIIILDDGFQYLRLARDLNLVMINCLNPFGNKQLLPAGILREPLDSLKRADLFVLAHTNLCSSQAKLEIMAYLNQFGKPVIETIHQPVGFIPLTLPSPTRGEGKNEGSGKTSVCSVPLWQISNKPVWGFCGIGAPEGFKRALENIQLRLKGFSAFPDHYPYRVNDVDRVIARARANGATALVTTEKDLARITYQTSLTNYKLLLPIYALRIELVITQGRDILEKALTNLWS